MSVNGECHIGEAFIDVQDNIQRKHYALEVLKAEYNKICSRAESNLKCFEELSSKMYNLNGNLKSIECRVEGYDKKEKDWEADANHLQMSVEELQILFANEEKQAEADDIEFDEKVLLLAKEIRKDREFYDCATTGQEIENLHDTYNCIKQETFDINQALVELKQKHSFFPSEQDLFILKNIDLRSSVTPEIKKLESIKATKQDQLNKLRNMISSMENEIIQLSNQ